MRRRTVRVLVIAVVLGFVTNALVTAWCVWRVAAITEFDSGYVRAGGRFIEYTARRAPGKVLFTWTPDAIATPGVDSDFGNADRIPEWSTILDVEFGTQVANSTDPSDYRRSVTPHRLDIAYGWPMLSFAGGITRPPDRHDYGQLSDMAMIRHGRGPFPEPRTVPLRPIVPGVAVNTATYAAAWCVLAFATCTVRRWTRLRRGACVTCGYDRRGIAAEAVCPECGAAGSAGQKGFLGPRVLRLVVIAVLLGAVSNVALTAGVVYFATASGNRGTMSPCKFDGRTFGLWQHEGTAKSIVGWNFIAGPELGFAELSLLFPDDEPDTRRVARPAPWSTLHSESWRRAMAQHPQGVYRVDVAYGWPCRSFRGGCLQGPNGQITQDFALNLGEGTATIVRAGVPTTVTVLRPTPLTPIPRGFVVNTAVYAGLWFALLGGWMVVRPWRRARRGLCVECGYDRRGIGRDAACPECGADEPSGTGALI